MQRSKNDVWVGLFVMVGLAAILFLALKAANLLNLSFQSEYRVVAKFDGPVPAPIAKGTKVGTASVSLPDGRTMDYPLEAGTDVPRKGLVGRVFTLARHYLLGWLS